MFWSRGEREGLWVLFMADLVNNRKKAEFLSIINFYCLLAFGNGQSHGVYRLFLRLNAENCENINIFNYL